jgi:xyloglucan-specific exo-beta-1,4-glucanase
MNRASLPLGFVLVLAAGCITPPATTKGSSIAEIAGGKAAPAPVTLGPYVWKNVEILGGGFVTGVSFSPFEKDLVYARTDIGGAYRFNADTESWIAITDQFGREDANFMGIESLALDPTDPNKVYIAAGTYTKDWAGPGAMLRSFDRGTTWEVTAMADKMGGNESGRSAGERLAVDPNLPTRLLFGSRTAGLLQSLDGSKTWSKLESFPQLSDPNAVGVILVVFDARSGKPGTVTPVAYAGVAKGEHSLYVTRDAGRTWEPVAGQPKGFIPSHLEIDGEGMVYISYRNQPGPNDVTDGAIHQYNPESNTWTDITPLRPSRRDKFGYGGVAVDRSCPGTLLASTLDRWTMKDEIFRTTDGGTTWKKVGSNARWDTDGAEYIWWGRKELTVPHWIGDIDIDPHNPDRAMFVSGAGIWMTENLTQADQGDRTKWRFFNRGLEQTAVAILVSPPSGPPLLSGVDDVCGFRHDDLEIAPLHGAFSNPRCNATTGIDFAERSPNFFARVGRAWGNEPHGATSTDGGVTWTPFASEPKGGETGGLIAVTSDGASLVWTTKEATPAYSKDRGRTWQPVRGLRRGIKLPDWANFDLQPASDRVNPKRVYIYDAHKGALHASYDGGATFEPACTDLPSLAEWQLDTASIETVPGIEGHLWVTTGAALLHSADGGRTFVAVDSVAESYGIGFGKAAPGRKYPSLYLAGFVNGVRGFFRSDDKGATWSRINDDAHQFGYVNVIEGDPRVFGRVYLGTSGRGVIVGMPSE